MTIESILIIDDDLIIRRFLIDLLQKEYNIISVENGIKAKKLIKNNKFDLIITDMSLPDLSGIDIIKFSKEKLTNTPIIVITGQGSIYNAVEAMRLGAFNYILKPFSTDTILSLIKKAEEFSNLSPENIFLKTPYANKNFEFPLISESSSMKKVIQMAKHVAKSSANVFIHGESGSGKEVVSKFLHTQSPRANNPYIRVNCAAIPDTLIESEFFGHEKGAFTGAICKKPGRFELANNGTLLLDEVTEIPLTLQPKLLRVIQEKEFERLGGTKTLSVDVRIIATSNRNLKEAIEEKIFRQDLYYRLNVIPLKIPPLRDRKEDIIPLSQFFLKKFCKQNNKKEKIFTESAKNLLKNYIWPGNVRELANIIERTIVLDLGPVIEKDHLYLE